MVMLRLRSLVIFVRFSLLLVFVMSATVIYLTVRGKMNMSQNRRPRFSPRIVCWVPTTAEGLQRMGETIRQTWGKRCDKLIFMTSAANEELGAIAIGVPDNPMFMTQKCVKSLLYLYERHLEEGDWFLKADDDTYIIVENLRYLLSYYDPDVPWITGHHLRPPGPEKTKGYFSGGAGYVMSSAALKKFAVEGIRGGKCQYYDLGTSTPEDQYIGHCMSNVSVRFASSYDVTNRETFHTNQFLKEFAGFNSKDLDGYSHKKDVDCCSPFSISFHTLDHPRLMLEMHAMLYFLRIWDGGLEDPLTKMKDWFRPQEHELDHDDI